MSGRSHLQGSPTLVVRFGDRAAANCRIAGMSAAGRWVAHARAAGLEPVAFVAPGAGRWPLATRADFRRVGVVGGVPILDADAPLPPGAQVLDGRYLPAPELLARRDFTDTSELIDFGRPAQAARRILLATAKTSDGVISRWLNRPVSQRISQLLLAVVPGIRPWHMTMVVALVAIAMVFALLTGGAAGLIWGGVLFHVASVLDGVDGEIARASYHSSQAGAVLDTRVDMLTNIGYFVGVAVALTRLYGGYQAIVGGLAVMFALTGLGTTAWLLKRLDRPGSFDIIKLYYRERFLDGWQKLVTETIVAMTSRDFFAFAFGVVIVAGFGWSVSWLLLGFTATYMVFGIAQNEPDQAGMGTTLSALLLCGPFGVVAQVGEEGVGEAAVAPLVLRHGGGGDPRLQRGRAQHAVAVAQPQHPLAVGQRQDQVAERGAQVGGELVGLLEGRGVGQGGAHGASLTATSPPP